MSAAGRLFTDEELLELARPPADQALHALATNDLPRLHQLLAEMRTGQLGVEGMGLHVLARFCGELRADLGEVPARAALDEAAGQIMRSFVRDWQEGREEEVIADLLEVFKHQGGGQMVPVRESADEVVFDLAPCGSGGRFVVDGSVDAQPRWYGRWDDGVPSACQACKACQRALNQATGEATWVTEISPEVPGRCTLKLRKQRTRGRALYPGARIYEATRTRMHKVQLKLARHDLRIQDLLRDHHREWMPWHDFLIALNAYLFGVTLRLGGTGYLEAKLEVAYNSVFRLFYPVYQRLGDAAHLRYLCTAHHYHMMRFTVREEDDRFAFRLDPCGSGGRLLRGEMWRNLFQYEATRDAVRVPQAHRVTFGRAEFPVYCTHCAAHNRDQFLADVLYFVNDGHAQRDARSACVQFTYKKGVPVARVPADLKAQVGLA